MNELMDLVNFDAEIQMSNVVASQEVTAFVGITPCYEKEYTLYSPNHYLVGLTITPRPEGAWAKYGETKDRIAMGDVVVIPPGIVQHGSLLPWTGIRKDICCLFPKARFEKLMNGPVEWSESNLRESVNLRSPDIRMALQRMGREVMWPGLATSIVMDLSASLIAVDLQRHFRRDRFWGRPISHVLTKRDLDRIDEFIHAHLAEQIYINDLASLCQLSVRHFSRLFKVTTGVTIANYVAKTRLEVAQDMLSNTKTAIKSVATKVGFSSVSNFTTTFKRLSGVTPNIFRFHSA
jgi:AraC family transcriptional regulator